MYARIRARDAGVRAPLHRMWYFFPPLVPLPSDPPTVNFHLVIDPLLLGFIPKSVVPTIRMILGAIVIGLCSVRRLTTYLEAVAMRAITRVE
ncbi:hypothetical protein FRC07_009240, partial [Ceratobasidium sp. 392]